MLMILLPYTVSPSLTSIDYSFLTWIIFEMFEFTQIEYGIKNGRKLIFGIILAFR